MYESHVTVVGNVATPVDFRTSPSGVSVVRFRLASTVRRYGQERGWSDGPTSFYTVWAWRSLAANVAASVTVGEPLVVQGQLRIREEERDGRKFFSADLSASTLGHDLSRGTSAFLRVSQARPELTASRAEASAGASTVEASAAGHVPVS